MKDILAAIKLLRDNGIAPGKEAMEYVFNHIDTIESEKPTKGQIITKSRIADEVASLITRYENDGGLIEDTINDFRSRVKDDAKTK